jgi:porphobilinogen deaminase
LAAETNCCCVGRGLATVVVVLDLEPLQAAASTGTSSRRRARCTRAEGSAVEVESVLGQ